MSDAIYTIGHSAHSVARLIELLQQHQVTAVADVRSQPYSRRHPQFNREPLAFELSLKSVGYVFLGEELGARSSDSSCYEGGKVQYDRLARTELFQRGLERIREGMAKGLRISLLCAEKDPLTCHRAILVSRSLESLGMNVRHILEDGALESHADAVQRLLYELKIGETNLFASEAQLIEDAYAIQGEKIAYDSRAQWERDGEGEGMSA